MYFLIKSLLLYYGGVGGVGVGSQSFASITEHGFLNLTFKIFNGNSKNQSA